MPARPYAFYVIAKIGDVAPCVRIVGAFLLLLTGLLHPTFAQQSDPELTRAALAFASNRSGRFQIYEYARVNPQSGILQVTTSGAGNQASRSPDWSSLGRIAYAFGASGVRGIHSVNPYGLLDQNLKSASVSGDQRDPSWSPDGRFIAYAYLAAGATDYDLWIHDTNGTPDDPTDDSEYPLGVLIGAKTQELQPTWAPDGASIAFMTSVAGAVGTGPNSKIAVVPVGVVNGKVQATGPFNLLTDDTYTSSHPTWSPDSRFIAFATTRNGNRDIYTMSTVGESDASNLHRLTTFAADNNSPAWSPDGTTIAYVTNRDGNYEIYLMPKGTGDSGATVRVTNDPGDDEDAAWQPLFLGIDASQIPAFSLIANDSHGYAMNPQFLLQRLEMWNAKGDSNAAAALNSAPAGVKKAGYVNLDQSATGADVISAALASAPNSGINFLAVSPECSAGSATGISCSTLSTNPNGANPLWMRQQLWRTILAVRQSGYKPILYTSSTTEQVIGQISGIQTEFSGIDVWGGHGGPTNSDGSLWWTVGYQYWLQDETNRPLPPPNSNFVPYAYNADYDRFSPDVFTLATRSTDIKIQVLGPVGSVLAGVPMDLQITVSNQGPSDATGVFVMVPLPPGSTSGINTSGCRVPASMTAAKLSDAGSGDWIICNVGSLPNSGTISQTIQVIPAITGGVPYGVRFTAVAGADNVDNSPSNNMGATLVTVQPSAATLAIAQTSSPSSPLIGGNLTYQISLSNQGSSQADGVTVTDTLPSGVTLVSATAATAQSPSISTSNVPAAKVVGTSLRPLSQLPNACPGTTIVTCTLGSVPAGTTVNINIVTQVVTAGPLTNTISASSTTAGTTVTNPTPTSSTTATSSAHLVLTGTASKNLASVGQAVTYSLTVTNAGPQSASGVTVVDNLPSILSLVSATASQGTCSTTPPVTCTIGTLANGATATVTITASATTAGQGTNNATASGYVTDPGSPQNSTNAALTVNNLPVILAVAPASGSQGQTLPNVIITGQNTNFAPGTTAANFGAGITVNGLKVNSPTSATANITIASSATPGSQTVTLTTGSEIASLLNGFIITAPVNGLPNLTWLGGGHTGGVRSVGAAPDGTIWSAGGDNTIKQWNAANMNMLRTFPLAQPHGAAFASNGQQGLVIGSSGVQAVSLTDGSVSRTFALGDLGGGAYLPAISGNGQTVAFGRSNYATDVLVFANGQGPESDFVASAYDSDGYWFGGVSALAVSADGQFVAAVLAVDYQVPGTIRLYRVSDGTLIRLLTYNTSNVQALAFSPDGTLLASSSADGKINVLRLSDLVVVSSIPVFESGTPVPGTALAFSPDGTRIAQGDSYAARIYHLPDGASQGRIPGTTAAVAFTPDLQWLVVGTNQNVRLWLIATLAPLPTVAPHSGSITAVAYSPRGDLVASASTDLTVKLRSAVDGSLVASLTGHTDVVNAVAFSPDGDMLATGSSDHTIRIWRTSDFTLLNTLTGHTQAVRSLAFSPDGSLLASGSSAPEQVVKLWSVGGTWSNTSTLTGNAGSVTSVQFSPDGQSVAGASDGGIVRLWQAATGALSLTYLAPSQGAMSLAFSPDGQLLIAGWGQNILVFQGAQTAPTVTVPAHSMSGTVVAYSPDGQRVLSGNPDGTLKLWNPAGWGLVTSYNQETDAGGTGVTSVGYAPDGTRFVYGRGDATIGVANTGSTALPATVTVTTNPPGLALTVDGSAYTGLHTFSWTRGASHGISVMSPQGANGTREMFQGWSDGGAQSHNVTPEESRIYTANFLTQYLLTTQVTPSGEGSIGASPTSVDGYYAAGTVVQLTETPATGYVFASWSGDASGTTKSVSVLMSQPRNVTASFSQTGLADIAVAMSSSVSQINSGKPLAFTVTVTNLGPAASGSMTLIANLPSAFSFVSASSSQGTCTGTVQVSCSLGTIQAAGVVTATINVTPIATGSISMTASVNGGTADPNPNNNSATVTVTVLPPGLPPILWMGGGLGGARSIFATTDGMIWTAGDGAPPEIQQWRASDMRLMRTLAPQIVLGDYRSPEPDIAVTSDGKYLAYATATSVGVYNASDGSLVRSFGYASSPSEISITDDGQTVAWTGCSNTVIGHVSDGSTITIPTSVCFYSSPPSSLVLSPDGTWLAAAGPTVSLYHASDGSYVRSLSGFTSAPDRLVWAADSNTLMAASSSQLIVFRVSDFLELQSFTFAPSYFHSANMSRDGQFVAFGGGSWGCGGWCAGPDAVVWRVSDGSTVTTIQSADKFNNTYGISFTPDNLWLICGEVDHLTAYALPQGAPSPHRTGNVYGDNAIAYSSAGNLIATGGPDQVISVWDSSAGAMLNYLSISTCSTVWYDCGPKVNGLAFSSGGALAAAVDNSILVWSTAGYSLTATLTGHTQPVEAVSFSPDGTLLASTSTSPEQVVKLWSTQTWTLVRTLVGASGGLRSVQFSPDGTKVVAGGDDGIAREWNVTTGAVVHSYLAPGQGSMRIQYSPDGTKLAAGWTGKVLLFTVGSSTPIQTLNAHTQNNTSVAWSPDGTRLISGNPDGTVDVWDTATWGRLSQYNSETYAQNGGVLAVAYSPDGSQFAYGRADSVLVVVDSGFSPTGTLTTVTTNPPGLNIVVDLTTTTSPQTFRWAAGTTHSIGAPSPQPSSGTRSVFANWSDGGAQTHTISTPSTGTTYTAQFNPQYLLTSTVSPGGSGSILVTPASLDGYYDSGVTVQAVAASNLGYVFGTWSGDATGTTNPASIAMTAPRSITANYSALPTTIVTTSPPGLLVAVDGTQYTTPQTFNWTAGTSHTVAVSPTQGARALRYAFNSWGDGGSMSHTVIAPSVSTTYIANFYTQYPLATGSNPSGGGTITANPASADGYYNSGASVQLTATAATGYQFSSWSGDVSGTTSPQSVTLSAARSATANFTIVSGPVLSITKTHVGNFTQGQNGATYSVVVSNATGAGPTSGTVTVTDTVPTGLTLVSMAGTGWTCPPTPANYCTRTDSLNGGPSYSAITVTVNVAANATSPQVNAVSVSGGGSVSAYTTDSTTIRSVGMTPDLVWQNDNTRQVTVWYMGGAGGAVLQGYNYLSAAGVPGWHVVAYADFNGDGVLDLVWQNDTTRQVTVWYLGGAGGATFQGYNFLSAAGVPGWHVAAVADFNGDGVPDLVWQNDSTRQVTVWYMGGAGGAVLQGYNYLSAAGVPGWHVAAAADFNRDGVPDLVWQNDTTRQVTVWYMGGVGGAVFQSFNYLSAAGVPGWHVVAAVDQNGDGVPDLVWQNDSTRQVTVWYMGGAGGAVFQSYNFLSAAGVPGWSALN